MRALLVVCGLSGTAAAGPWVQELVDYEMLADDGISIVATPSGPAILASPGSILSTSWLVRGADGWTQRLELPAGGRGVTVDSTGTPWFLRQDDETLVALHGPTTETIWKGGERWDRAAIAFDAAGSPHVCIAGEQANVSGRPANDTLRYATRGKKTWTVAALPAKARGCTIEVAGDGAIWIGTTDGAIVRRQGTWKAESLGGETRVAAGADGKVVAVTAKGASLVVTRDGVSTMLVDKLDVYEHAIAVDARGRVHVVVDARDKQGVGSIHYAVEGTPGTQLVANADAEMGLAIAVDGAGEPHVAFGAHWQQPHNQTLRYARRRIASDTQDILQDVGGMITACGGLLADQLAGVERSNHRAPRMCAAFKSIASPKPLLEQRCTRDAGACLMLAALDGGKLARTNVITFEITPCKAKSKQNRCYVTYREETQFGNSLVPARDLDGRDGLEPLRKACDLGHRGACFQLALADDPDDFDMLVKHCSPELPMPCALALVDARGVKTPSVRAALDAACKRSTNPVACGALAYIKDMTGAPAQALRHHARACVLGNGTSCARLVGRGAPPKDLEPEHLAELLEARCGTHNGAACVAYATAHERGWLLERHRDKAKAILETACGERIEGACKKLGRKLSAE